MAIKVIIMDIDGTLVNDEKVITPLTKETLLKAQDKGVRLVLASGRPTSGLLKLAEELDMRNHHGLFVCFNGSKVVDCQSHETLYNHAISVEDSKAVLEHLKNFKARPMFDKDEYMYVNDVFDNTIIYKGKPFNVMQYESRGNNYILCEKRDLAAFVDFEINKILTFGDPDYLQAHYKEMMEPFKDRLNCMFTSDFYFEYTAKGVDKAKALDSVLIPMGYKKEEMDKLMAEAGTIQDLLTMHDFYMIDAKVEEVARALGLSELGLDKDVTELSGGQRTKVLLGKLLLEKPDILLLDEPTNYLDKEHIEWLKRYLNDYENAFILISHDIPFLNSVVNLIYHMDNKKLDRYVGDYDKFMEVYEMKKAQLEAAYNKQQQEIKELKDFVARNKAQYGDVTSEEA